MKRLRLSLLGSKTVIQAARIPSFTYVLRRHTISLKGKGRNIISSTSVAGAQLLDYWLANTNVHQLLKLGYLPTLLLPNTISPIFLWAEFSQRNHITIDNPLLNIVYIFGGRWGTHSYSDSPKNNKETYYFRNGLLSLC